MFGAVSSRDVRQHLADLGYGHVNDAQLREFMRDLKKLIKYEEKAHKEKECVVPQPGRRYRKLTKRPASVASTDSTSSAYSSSSSYTPERPSRAQRKVKEFSVTELRSSSSCSVVSSPRSSANASSTLVSSSNSEVTASEVVVRVHMKDDVDLPERFRRGKRRSSSEPPTNSRKFGRPTTSFIRPLLPQTKGSSLKTDPVRRHAAYQEYWKKFRFPGDGSDKNLRWAVREWMMRPKQE